MMQVTVDISKYPLTSHYEAEIVDFIDRLRQHPDLDISVNPLSTQVRGEFTAVFAALQREMETSLAHRENTVFAVKVAGGDRRKTV